MNFKQNKSICRVLIWILHCKILFIYYFTSCFVYSRDQRESRWSLGIDIFCPVSTGLGLDIQQISQSRLVSVSTSIEFLSLDESRSQQIFRYQSQTRHFRSWTLCRSRWSKSCLVGTCIIAVWGLDKHARQCSRQYYLIYRVFFTLYFVDSKMF